MKILFLEWNSFGNEDMLSAYASLGYEVIRFPISNHIKLDDTEFTQALTEKIRLEQPDYLFTFNYFPPVSLVCHHESVPYVSWVYDSPYVQLYSYTTIYPCNYIFVFDKELVQEFQSAGIKTVRYLPMAADPARLDLLNDFDSFSASGYYPSGDVSFIGSMYTEKHQFYERMTNLDNFTRGYLEGIMEAQQHVYGYNFIQELLTPNIVEGLQKALPMEPDAARVETVEYLYAQYVINRKITGLERQKLLTAIGEHYALDLYTPDKNLTLPGTVNHGSIPFFDVAPYVFKTSPINLNISLRSIKSGMPLRIFDIMGSGGFLLTNYQADFLDYFIPGEDFAYFDSPQDMLGKIEYYLSHPKERKEIAINGHRKIKEAHTYLHRISEIEQVLRTEGNL